MQNVIYIDHEIQTCECHKSSVLCENCRRDIRGLQSEDWSQTKLCVVPSPDHLLYGQDFEGGDGDHWRGSACGVHRQYGIVPFVQGQDPDDDLNPQCLICRWAHPHCQEQELQQMLDVLDRACTRWGVRISTEKTKIPHTGETAVDHATIAFKAIQLRKWTLYLT